MQRSRIVLLAIFVILSVVAVSFSVVLYSPNNSITTSANSRSSAVQCPDSMNGTFGNYFLDNFTKDTTLNKSLWVINGNALSNAETNFPVSPEKESDKTNKITNMVNKTIQFRYISLNQSYITNNLYCNWMRSL